jgi:MYXO-CTERM domain-containing protein
MTMMPRTSAVRLLLLGSLAAAPAFANGRYPSAQQLLIDPSDPDRMWLRATYGLLTSADAGKSWGWICETAVGYSSGEDPMLTVTADGTTLAGATAGLFVTTDRGCNWSSTPNLDGYVIDDLAMESDAVHVYALTNFVQSDGQYDLGVWRSDDSGHSFAAQGPIIGSDMYGRTLDVAPSDPNRLYVTAVPAHGKRASAGDAGLPLGVDPRSGALFVSRDRGATWQEHAIGGTSLDDQPFIGAVHPSRPDVLFVRTRSPETDVGFVRSRLLYSDTAGASFREVFSASADMLGFALGDGGNRVLVGFGDSRDQLLLRPVDKSALGIYRADTSSFVFEPALRGQVGCLTFGAGGLFVCGSNATTHYELGVSRDVGSTASPVFKFGRQMDLLACGSGSTVAKACTTLWPDQCNQLGKCSEEQDAGGPPPAPPSDDGGCSVSATSSGPDWLIAVAGALAALVRRRRGARDG